MSALQQAEHVLWYLVGLGQHGRAGLLRIWVRVSSAVSLAKSVSRMRLREADRFSEEVCRLATTEVNRFWIAPRSARTLLTDSRALSTMPRAFCAPT